MPIINEKIDPEKIEFQDFNPITKKVFQKLQNVIEVILTGFKDYRIEHVGSTSMSIPGKNFIDILII